MAPRSNAQPKRTLALKVTDRAQNVLLGGATLKAQLLSGTDMRSPLSMLAKGGQSSMAQPVLNRAVLGEHERQGSKSSSVRFLTFNIQSGISTTRYSQYVTRYWKHVLPHEARARNLQRIGDLVQDYDVVALQEIDGGSLRSGFINQVEYLAGRAAFPYWYTQCNRDLGPFAQMGNGVLSRIKPRELEDHKLPGAIPGRGALVLRLPFGADPLTGEPEELMVVLLHLSLGGRSQEQQLEYVGELIDGEPNVVVLGDLNNSLAAVMSNSALAGCGLRSHPRACPTYPSWKPSRVLDHALISQQLTLSQYEVLDCGLSDHCPVAVTVERRERGTPLAGGYREAPPLAALASATG